MMGDTTAVGELGPGRGRVAPTDEQVDVVVRVSRMLAAITARAGAAVEDRVTPPQLRVLLLVADRGRINIGAVARGLGVHPSSATRTCDRMVGMGLLHRYDDPGDRRNLVIELTAVGRELLAEVDTRHRDAIAAVLAGLPPESRESLTSALRTLATTDADAGDVTGTWRRGVTLEQAMASSAGIRAQGIRAQDRWPAGTPAT